VRFPAPSRHSVPKAQPEASDSPASSSPRVGPGNPLSGSRALPLLPTQRSGKVCLLLPPKPSRMAAHDYDTAKIDEMALAILSLTMHSDGFSTRAWKGLSWEVSDRLHANGWIGDPRNNNKSVVFTEEGERLAREFADKHFSRDG